MIDIRKAIHAKLKSLTDNQVFHHNVSDDKAYPYIVYRLEISSVDESTDRVDLEINGWDNTDDTTALETMMANIDLDKTVITTDDLSVVFYIENKLVLDEEDNNIKRRRYSYTGKLFERS